MNRLASSTSPYLLQHRDNPVDWWEWSPDAFAEAKRRDVPILLSVGYAACHWCHVMAHESFENSSTAALMNARFVCVKVDREERPDVDAVYMAATQALTGRGGWPMTVFVDHDGRPFYAGTYFPPEPRHGMPSFPALLEAISGTWSSNRDQTLEAATRITEALAERQPAPGAGLAADVDLARAAPAAVQTLAGERDPVNGGFGDSPKFPPSMVCEFLVRHAARHGVDSASGALALQLAESTLDAMARGGLFDQLGGGFARYSVDAEWVVPHFEKMLYDNALLLSAYVHHHRLTGSLLSARVTAMTADFMIRELLTEQGGFASSLDADSLPPDQGLDAHAEEGAFYAWAPEELVSVLGEADGAWAAKLLRVTRTGTFERGKSTLQLPDDPDDPQRFESVRTRLLAARAERPRPGRDDKVVAAWNGLAISALAHAGAVLERPEWVSAATACAELLISVHLRSDGIRRVSRHGIAGAPAAVLEDLACLAEGFIALGSVTGESRWAIHAEGLLERILTQCVVRNEAGAVVGFFDTADDAEVLVLRPADPGDNATPSGASAAVSALLSYSALTGSSRHRQVAEQVIAAHSRLLVGAPRFSGWWWAAVEALADGPREIAIIGAAGDPLRTALHRAALLGNAPGSVVAVGEPGDTQPLLANRGLVDGRAAAYVCRGFQCDLPTSDAAVLGRQVLAR